MYLLRDYRGGTLCTLSYVHDEVHTAGTEAASAADPWIHGSSRPNHMLGLLDALQTLRPVDLRRLPRQFHSVAKRASLYIAFGTDFQGFWEVWGSQLGGKN